MTRPNTAVTPSLSSAHRPSEIAPRRLSQSNSRRLSWLLRAPATNLFNDLKALFASSQYLPVLCRSDRSILKDDTTGRLDHPALINRPTKGGRLGPRPPLGRRGDQTPLGDRAAQRQMQCRCIAGCTED